MTDIEKHLWANAYVAHVNGGMDSGGAAQHADEAVLVFRSAPDRVNGIEEWQREKDRAAA